MPKKIIKITTAGSVDDGKSTLLARLMLETNSFFSDQLEHGKTTGNIADLIDGLESERSQGITIDVANRFLDIGDDRFHFRDAPGHEQYTRNLATACAGSDAVILLIDPREGLKPQTKLHLEIALMFGIKQILVAVSKMDLVRYSSKRFKAVEAEVREFISKIGFAEIDLHFVPLSGHSGQGIVSKGKSLSWYSGPTLLELMKELNSSESGTYGKPIVVLEGLQRTTDGGRHYLASLLSGVIEKGDVLTDGHSVVKFKSLGVFGSGRDQVEAPAQFDFCTDGDVDIDRGAILAHQELKRTSSVSAKLIWFSNAPGLRGRSYLLQMGHSRIRCTIAKLEAASSSGSEKQDSGETRSISVNEVKLATLSLSSSLPFLPMEGLAELSRGTLLDPHSGETIGAFIFEHSMRRGENVFEHSFQTSRSERELFYGAQAKVIWLTGLSGSGKSTIADRLSLNFLSSGRPHVILDGDAIRKGLSSDLGFTEGDRSENIRRVAELAKVIVGSGITVIVSLVSPLRADRQSAKQIVGAGDFVETFVDTPIEVCAERDPKGLYAKALKGEIPNFTGVTAPYEAPESPDLHLDGSRDLDDIVETLLSEI